MSLLAQFVRTARLPLSTVRNFSTVIEPAHMSEEPIQTFRTIESNPVNHNTDHLHRFYTIPSETKNQLFRFGGLPKKYYNQINTFLECSILVRSPAIEIISYLKQSDYSRPPNKYLLYGHAIGTGKSMTLCHVLHYAYMAKKLIVHVPWAPYWYKYPKEFAVSLTREGYFDLPLHAAAWLIHFKHQNSTILPELDIKVSKDYEWSTRESTKAGAPLTELIDFGISRIKYACDIIYAITEEIKVASTAGKCNTLVVIDGFNAFFADFSKIKDDNRKKVLPMKVSLTEAFLNITKSDWCNGSIVLTVDPIAEMDGTTSGLPIFLLRKEGFEHIDPFLPVPVENFTSEEFDATIEYYKDRKWIRNVTEDGKRELELLSARNPYMLMTYSTPL